MDKTIEHIIYKQPFEYKIDVTQKTNAKQELTPEVSVSLSRKFEDTTLIMEMLKLDIEEVEKKENEYFFN